MLNYLTKENKIEILTAHGYRIKTVTETYESRYGGEEYKKFVEHVVDLDGNPVTISVGAAVPEEYYIDEVVMPIVRKKIMRILTSPLAL